MVGKRGENYYHNHKKGKDQFSWIKIHPLMSEEIQKKYPIDHAGKLETSLMMVFCPKGVNIKKSKKKRWYTKTANQATENYGNKVKKLILQNLKKAYLKND